MAMSCGGGRKGRFRPLLWEKGKGMAVCEKGKKGQKPGSGGAAAAAAVRVGGGCGISGVSLIAVAWGVA